MSQEAPKAITADSIFEQYHIQVAPEDVEKEKLAIQDAIDQGFTEFRVSKYVGAVSDDEARVAAQLNIGKDEIELTTWDGHQGTDVQEWITLIGKKPATPAEPDFEI